MSASLYKGYQIASKTTKGSKKEESEPNGDWLRWLENEKCVVLALADGIGANDARAARTTCDDFIKKCDSALRQGRVLDEAVIRSFCTEIDSVLAGRNDKTCFSVVVWYVAENQVTWLNAGDTRIYRYDKSSELTQMTVDDRRVQNKKSNNPKYGKYYTDHGALVPNVGVSVAIGDCSLEFHTGVFAFESGDSLVLCSDGIHQSSSFARDIMERLNAPVLSEAISTISTNSQDDATLLVIRREVAAVDMPEVKTMMADFETCRSKWPLNAIVERFACEIMRMIDSGIDVEKLAETVRFAKEHELYPAKAEITKIFEAAMAASKERTEDADCYRQICGDLKDMLQYVYRHVSLT